MLTLAKLAMANLNFWFQRIHNSKNVTKIIVWIARQATYQWMYHQHNCHIIHWFQKVNSSILLPSALSQSEQLDSHFNITNCQSLFFSEFMESTINWQDELNKYWIMIDEQTKSSLQLIKSDRIRKGLTFDDQFYDEILRSTNSRYQIIFRNIFSYWIIFKSNSAFICHYCVFPEWFDKMQQAKFL